MAGQEDGKAGGIVDQLPTDQLKQEVRELLKVAGQRATQALAGKLGSVTKQATGALKGAGEQVVEAAGGGGSIAKEAVKGGLTRGVKGAAEKVGEKVTGGGDGGGGGDRGKQSAKVTNIVEQIDVGVPVRVAYDQWTRFTDFPGFMKKVESVEQVSDTELKWRGRILWSSRDWKSTILDQVPDQRIVWRSEGSKGYVDGAVTFHELSPTLTRILVVLEYYPQGFFEKTANLWRAQGRRVRLELKHFRRQVMTETMLHPDEVEGWRGEIHDSEVTKSPQEQEQAKDEQEQPQGEDEQQEQPQGEGEQEQPQGKAGQHESQSQESGEGQ